MSLLFIYIYIYIEILCNNMDSMASVTPSSLKENNTMSEAYLSQCR